MAEPAELEMILALSGDQVKSLLVNGLSREQIVAVGRSIRGFSKGGVKKRDLNKIIENLSKNVKLRSDFFEDPLTAIKTMGVRLKRPISKNDLIGANPTPHPVKSVKIDGVPVEKQKGLKSTDPQPDIP